MLFQLLEVDLGLFRVNYVYFFHDNHRFKLDFKGIIIFSYLYLIYLLEHLLKIRLNNLFLNLFLKLGIFSYLLVLLRILFWYQRRRPLLCQLPKLDIKDIKLRRLR